MLLFGEARGMAGVGVGDGVFVDRGVAVAWPADVAVAIASVDCPSVADFSAGVGVNVGRKAARGRVGSAVGVGVGAKRMFTEHATVVARRISATARTLQRRR